MNSLRLEPAVTWGTRRQFINLPAQIHAKDSRWVPSLRWEEKRLLGFVPGHPFPKENPVQAWLAFRGKQPVGRIAASCCLAPQNTSNQAVGYFGFFECFNDPEAARLLVQTAAQWVGQHGLEHLRGPMSPSINYSVGVLTNGFDRQPSFQIPYNPNYYDELLVHAGLRLAQELYALEIFRDHLSRIVDRLERVGNHFSGRHSVRFRPLNRKNRHSDLQLFLSIAQQSLMSHWGFVPLSEREQKRLAIDMSWLVIPELLQFAEVNGQVVAAALALPDYADRIRQIDGKLFPTGFFRLLMGKQRIKNFRVVATNILPNFKRWGLAPALIGRISRIALSMGAQKLEFSWIAQSNPLSFGTIENGGAQRSKTLKVYEAACAELLA